MSDTPYSDALSSYFNKKIHIEADIDASGAKKGAEDFDDATKKIKKSQDKIKGTTKITTEFDTKGLEKTQRDIYKTLDKIDKTLGGLGKNMGSTLGHNLEKSFSSPTVTKAINGIGDRIKTSIAKSMIAGTAQARGELAQNIKALQKSVVDPINEMIDFKSVRTALSDITNSGEMRRFMEVIDMMSGDRLADNLKRSLSSLRDLSLRDKRLLGLLNQDTYNLSDKGSMQVASDLKKQEAARTKLLKPYYAAREKEANANARHIENQEKREQRAEERELRKEAEQRQKAEQQRLVRQQLYRENVGIAVSNAQSALLNTSDYDQKKLTDNYNRAVARIRGIYQSAVVHGRVENPETIQAGIAELQRRSLELNNYRLQAQLGINDINDKLKTTVRRTEDMGTRWNKISSVLQNSVQAFSTMQSFAYRITSTITRFARTTLTRITSQVRSLVSESTTAFKSLEVSMIGFRNFFGEDQTDRLYQQVKSIAARAPGLATTDLADYVRQIAPVSGHNADLALNAALGMLKTIQYGGASGSTEMEYVIKNIRDVLAKGKATAIDIRQFNRAMPILEEVLGSVGQSQLLKDGVLTINEDNVDTILSAFAALNTSNQSAVKDIFSQMNQTLSGQWEQFREQFTTNLMEALRGSQVYGGAQNLLSQLNEGEYINSGLRKLQESLAQFINNINWFKLQRIAGEIWEGMKIIWEGVEDAAANIMEALGKTRSGNVIKSFSQWIADLIRGMSDGVTLVIKFVQYLERSGVMNGLSRMIGWFGSIGAPLVRVMGTMLSHITNIAGNLMQVASRVQKLMLTRRLSDLNARLEAIPISARSQMVTANNLLNGTGIADSSEASAINNLTNVVNTHLMKIEANQTGSASTLGRVETAFNNGKQFVWTDDFDGAGHGAIGTWNKSTKSYDWSGYSNNAAGYARYQQLTTQNFLQGSNSAFLQRVGNNKVVDATIKWIKTAGTKILSFTQKLIGNLFQGGIALMVTQSITGIIESLELFGDSTTVIAGAVRAAGYAITGALVGKTFGKGLAGGVVGALVGLGIGIAQLVDAVKKKADEIKNVKFQNALNEEQMNIRNSVKDAMIGVGALTQNLNERTNEENYALQRLSDTIANSSIQELLGLDAEGLENIYLDAKRYKTIQEDFTNKNEGKGFDWSLYSTGRVVTKNDKDYLAKIFDAVNKFDLLASHGYNQAIVDGQRVYVDDNGNPLSAETIWDEFFATQDLQEEVLSGQIDEMQKYLEDKENKTEDENKTFREKLEKQEQTIVDSLGTNNTWSDLVHSKLVEANEHLTDIANNTAGELSSESIQTIYGGQTGASAEAWNKATGYPNAWDFINKSGRIGTGLQTAIRSGLATQFGWDLSSKNMPAKDYLKGLGNQYNFPNLEIDAVDTFTDDEAQRVLNYIKDNGLDGVRQDKILDKIENARASAINADDRQKLAAARNYLADFKMEDDLTNILWWFRWLLNAEKDIESTGLKLFAHGGLLTTPAYRSIGVDTVPAMLSPGEFVMKPSAVKKAGLGMMYALNRGDLGAAARTLAGNVNNNWYRNNNASINNSRSTRTSINNFKIINKNASARMNSYFSLANRLAF